MHKLLNYEYKDGILQGINFGDLYINAITNIHGDLAKSIEKCGEIFSIVGKVLPVTLDEMNICVELENGMVIDDKEKIADITSERVTKINRVFLNPSNCRTTPGIVEAIQQADAIIIGPRKLIYKCYSKFINKRGS